MPLILPGNVATATAPTGYEIANSCLFNDNDSPYLSRTLGSETNRDRWTYSVWLKRSILSTTATLHHIYTDGDNHQFFKFDSSHALNFNNETGASVVGKLFTNALYRDPLAWMHIVIVWDTANATAGNRMRMYVNGAEVTSFATDTQPSLNADSWFYNTKVLQIGRDGRDINFFDGYMAEVVFCDGQAYAASDFGEYDSDSPTIWKPKDVSELTFGNNGFWLDFEDSSALGNDVSGNNNDFTATNLAAVDQCVDTPTNNFATLNPLHMSDPSANFFVDNGNNTLEATNNDVDRLVGATIHPQGIKGYFEFKALTDNNWRVALQEDGVAMTKNNYTALASGQFYGLDSSGNIAYANGGSSPYHIQYYISGSTANGDIIGCAFDFTGSNRNVWFHKNGTYGNNGSGVGNPATGANPGLTVTQLALTKEFEFVFMCNTGGSSSSIGLNFGNGNYDGTAISSAGTNASFGSFEYDVPSGFGPICTKTLNGTYS